MTLKGNGVTRADRWGKRGGGNSPATRYTKGSNNTSSREDMASGQEPALPSSTQRGTAEGEILWVSTQRHLDGTNGTRPEHGALVRHEYGLLAPEEPAGDLAAAGPQGSRDSPGDTTGTGGTNGRETGMGEQDRQRALLARDHPEDEEEE